MLPIVLLVLFVMVMFLWALSLFGAVSVNGNILAFAACLILGIVVFLSGTGLMTWR